MIRTNLELATGFERYHLFLAQFEAGLAFTDTRQESIHGEIHP